MLHTWIPATHVGDTVQVPGFCIQFGPAQLLQALGSELVDGRSSLSLSLFQPLDYIFSTC